MADTIIRDINNVLTVEHEVNGKMFARSYGKNGFYIELDGEMYSEAIDPTEYKDERIYTETDIPIEKVSEEATIEDYQNVLRDLGVL